VVANITLTPNSGANYTYQRWDFDTTATTIRDTYNPAFLINPETSQNPYGTALATVHTQGNQGGNGDHGGWLDTSYTGLDSDVMRSGSATPLYLTLTIPNVANVDMQKIVQLEFAYNMTVGNPNLGYRSISCYLFPVGNGTVTLNSTVSGTDGSWQEMTYTWTMNPQPASETISLNFNTGIGSVDLNHLEVATVCVPEPATICLLGLGALVLRRKVLKG